MAFRWIELLRALTPGSRPPFRGILRVFFVSTFVGTFLPSVGGDVYRAYSLARHHVRMSESVASVLMDRLLGVLSMVIVGAAALIPTRDVELQRGVVPVLVASALACALVALVIFSERAARVAERLTAIVPFERLRRVTSTLTDAVRRYADHHGKLLSVLIVSVIVQIIRVIQAWCLGRGIGIELPLTVYFAFMPLVLLVMLLPITVNGLGTSQLAFNRLFVPAGATPTHAFALSILFVALGIVGNLPGGILYATATSPPSPPRSAS